MCDSDSRCLNACVRNLDVVEVERKESNRRILIIDKNSSCDGRLPHHSKFHAVISGTKLMIFRHV